VGVGLLFAIPNPVTDAASQYIPVPATETVDEAATLPVAEPAALPMAEPAQAQVAYASAEQATAEPVTSAADAQPTPAPVEEAPVLEALPPTAPVMLADPPAVQPAPPAVRQVALNPGGVVAGIATICQPAAAAVDPATGAPLPMPATPGGGPAAGFFVTFFQNGQVLAQTTTDAAGNFRVSGLAPGVYSVVVSRDTCASAYTVEVQPPGAGVPDQLLICAGPCEEYTEVVGQEQPFGMMGGVMGGGMMGGGGGGGDMGGFGSLLGLAGLAGLAGLSDDDDGRIITEQILVSPFVP
jgi:hypothetical protein